MIKKHTVYKKDKWNMVNVEVHGKQLVVRVITDQWGEECQTFLSRPEMMHWVNERYMKEQFDGTEEERAAVLEAFREI
ncbi:hypothetical protein [Paenibacillus sp. YYML68]|uniref:hypothetical protein n=1 Tax=Paenibacillus sp. YYML68 TaxID=2909250 RepID=UPI002492F74D|nr:hypothetical protein [Paenibacillus sp. YYML68]